MLKRTLGRTGLEVTTLGLGCFQFTGEFGVDPRTSEELMDYAMSSDVNIFDTAEMYGFGESEEIVGRALDRHPNKRAVISTNVGYLGERTVARTLGAEAFVNEVEIRRALKHSLWLLRRDHFDLLLIHEPDWPQWQFDYETGDSVVLSVLEQMKQEGVVANIGIGGNELARATQLVRTGRIDVAMVAFNINLLSRRIFDEFIPTARKSGTGVMVGACFGQNNPFLTGIRRSELPSLLEAEEEWKVLMGRKLDALYDVAEALQVNMFELAIRYVLSFDDIHTILAGARELAHLRDNITYVEKGPLEAQNVDEINGIQDRFSLAGDNTSILDLGPPPGFIFDEKTFG